MAEIGSLTVKLKFKLSLWDAIKIRIAGKRYAEEIIKKITLTFEENK